MAAHSNIVGGSTAKRVIACPGSVKLVQQMPPRPSSRYADEGTLCHNIMEGVLAHEGQPEEFIGQTLGGVSVTAELIETKIRPALEALDLIDPGREMTYECEATVGCHLREVRREGEGQRVAVPEPLDAALSSTNRLLERVEPLARAAVEAASRPEQVGCPCSDQELATFGLQSCDSRVFELQRS